MSDRNGKGQFKRGCRPGPGRPPRVTETDFLLALADAVTPDRWQRIINRAIDDAENGDDRARAWLSSHLLPKAGSGVLGHKAEAEARQDRIEWGEQTMEDLLFSLPAL